MGSRIVVDSEICHGQPCIKGTRIMAYLIFELLESGASKEKIIKDYYPELSLEDIDACFHFAAEILKNQQYLDLEEAA